MKTIGTIFAMLILVVMCTNTGAEEARIKGLKAVAGNGVVYLSWSKSKNEKTGYTIYRATPEESYQRINPIIVKGNFYKDLNVINGQAYWYKIAALDNENNEDRLSEEVSATPNVTNKNLSGY